MSLVISQSASSVVSMPRLVSLGQIQELGSIDNDLEAHPS